MGSIARNQLAASGLSRRTALGLLGAASASVAAGCCSLRGFPSDTIAGDPALNLGTPLRPVKAPSNGEYRHIDVHAHFFNASDVTVKGYLEGPVAHDMSEPLAELDPGLRPWRGCSDLRTDVTVADLLPSVADQEVMRIGIIDEGVIPAETPDRW